MVFFCHLQGEDGFPGIKGDFGVKGERVNELYIVDVWIDP